MILQLTDEMRKALTEQHGRPVLIIDPATQQQYVLLPAAAFQKVQALLFDDSPASVDELMPLVHDAFAEDWNAPGMEAYDSIQPQPKP